MRHNGDPMCQLASPMQTPSNTPEKKKEKSLLAKGCLATGVTGSPSHSTTIRINQQQRRFASTIEVASNGWLSCTPQLPQRGAGLAMGMAPNPLKDSQPEASTYNQEERRNAIAKGCLATGVTGSPSYSINLCVKKSKKNKIKKK